MFAHPGLQRSNPVPGSTVTFAGTVPSWPHVVLSGIFCVLVQMGRKIGVTDGKVQTEIWIFPKPRMTVPGLTLQIWAPVGYPQRITIGSAPSLWGYHSFSIRTPFLGLFSIPFLTLPILLVAHHCPPRAEQPQP